MPLYDFVLTDGQSGQMLISPRMEAPDLQAAADQAIVWARDTREIHGDPNDRAKWPLTIVESREPHEAPPEHVLFRMEDVSHGS